MERIATGILGLDRLLQGGPPAGSMTLLLGPPGSGKSTLTKQYLYTGVLEAKPSILIDTYESREDIFEIARSHQWDPDLFRKVTFVDCYSWRLGKKPEGYGARPGDVTEISIIVSKILEDFGEKSRLSRVVLDSFSDVVRSVGEDASTKFLEVVKAKLAGAGMTSLVTLEEGMHPQPLVTTIEYICDGTIRMRLGEAGRQMTITRMRATPPAPRWADFEIARGIELKVMEFFK